MPGFGLGTLRAVSFAVRVDLDGEPLGGVEEFDQDREPPRQGRRGAQNKFRVLLDQAVQARSLQGAVEDARTAGAVVVEPELAHGRIAGRVGVPQPGPVGIAPDTLFHPGRKEKGVGSG